MSEQYDPASDGWHLDRRVPLALIVAILITYTSNLGLGVWFVSDLYHRVANNSQAITQVSEKLQKMDERSDNVEKSIIELRSDVKHGNQLLQEIREQLQRNR